MSVGPVLIAVMTVGASLSIGGAVTSDAARNSLRSDPDDADMMLLNLPAETVSATEEIRRLVHAMARHVFSMR